MTIAASASHHLPQAGEKSITRLQAQFDFCGYSEDPIVHVRNAWTRKGKAREILPIGTSIALVFGETALLCSLRATTPTTHHVHARLLPSDIALREDISLEVWPQWRYAGHASDYVTFDQALPGLPWRWNFQKQGDALVVVPETQLLSKAKGLQISRPFACEPLLELHPYLGNGVKVDTYLNRHPPDHPTSPQDAWGWLLPTAPWLFELECYRFRSVWEYAVNPILRGRLSKPETILERVTRATRHRLALDDAWRIRAQNHVDVVRLLAKDTVIDGKENLYFLELSKLL